MDRRQGAVTPRGDGRWKRGILRKPRHFSPCTSDHLPPSQTWHLPPASTQPALQGIPRCDRSAGTSSPKPPPSSGASSCLAPAHANTHADPGPFLEIVSPCLQAAIAHNTSNTRGPTSLPSRQHPAACYLNLGSQLEKRRALSIAFPGQTVTKITSLSAGQRSQRALKIRQAGKHQEAGETLSSQVQVHTDL